MIVAELFLAAGTIKRQVGLKGVARAQPYGDRFPEENAEPIPVYVGTEQTIQEVEQCRMTYRYRRVHEDLSIDQVGEVLGIEPIQIVFGREKLAFEIGGG